MLAEFTNQKFRRRSRSVRGAYLWIRRRILYREIRARKLARSSLPPADSLRLDRDLGFLVLDRPDLPHLTEVVREAQRLSAARDLETNIARKKSFLDSQVLDCSRLTLDSPFIRFGLQQEIVAAVAEYLGEVPVLSSVLVWNSREVDAPPSASQLYHSDWADTRQVKLFVFCSDVTPELGPLTVIAAKDSARIMDCIDYSWKKARYRVSDSEIDALVGPDEQHALTGRAGTVALVDTCRCFHFGSRVTARQGKRCLAVYQYLRPSAFAFPDSSNGFGRLSHLVEPGMPAYERLLLDPVAAATPDRPGSG